MHEPIISWSIGSTRRAWVLFFTVFVLLYCSSKIHSSDIPEKGKPIEDVHASLELSPLGGRNRSPMQPIRHERWRDSLGSNFSPRSSSNGHSPRSHAHISSEVQEAFKELKSRLPNITQPTDTELVRAWIYEKMIEGKVDRKDLMKSVIAVSMGKRRWKDHYSPSTKTDLLRQSSNILQFSPAEVQALTVATKNDPAFNQDKETSPTKKRSPRGTRSPDILLSERPQTQMLQKELSPSTSLQDPEPRAESSKGPSFSPEVEKLLAEIPDVPFTPMSEEEILLYSPFVGVERHWQPKDRDSDKSASFPTQLPYNSYGKLTEDVDEILAALEHPSDLSGPPEQDGRAVDSPQDAAPSDISIEAKGKHEQPTSGIRKPQGSLADLKAMDGMHPETGNPLSFPMRSWNAAKALGKEHKGKLQVAGVLALVAALIAGGVLAHKKIHRRVTISNPLVTTTQEKSCRVLIDFEKGNKLKSMGTVASIDSVQVNNSLRLLIVKYTEKPALRSSRGRDILSWLKYRATFGRALTRREETLTFSERCMAGKDSWYQVGEKDGQVQCLLVDLDMNPGPLTVPREILETEQINAMMVGIGRDLSWQLYDNCVMHITLMQPFLGAPIVQVDVGRGRLRFENPELHQHTALLPRECDWREPWKLRLIYKSDSNLPLDLLLIMGIAENPVPETQALTREAGSPVLETVSLEDDDNYGLSLLFGDD